MSDALKKLFPSVVFTNASKLKFLNLGPFGKRVLADIRSVTISKGEYAPSDILEVTKLKDLRELVLDDVTFCFKCSSIYIARDRLPEQLMMRGVNGVVESEIQKLRVNGIVVRGTVILRQETKFLGWPKDAPPSISVCKVRFSESSEEPPVFIEGNWDEDSEDSIFSKYLKEHPSWLSIRNVRACQGVACL